MAPHHARSARSAFPPRRAPARRRVPAVLALLATATALTTGCSTASGPPDGADAGGEAGRTVTSTATGSPGPGDAPGGGAGRSPSGTPDGGRDGEGSENGGTSGPAPGGSATGGGTPWCTADALSPSLRGLEAAAGNRYAALVLTNTSGRACRTQGWPGLEFAAADGTGLPTETARDDSEPARRLTLRPGASAWSRLHWTVVPGVGDPEAGGCPAPARLRVIPPDQRSATTADWGLGDVCAAGGVEALPLRPGPAPAS